MNEQEYAITASVPEGQVCVYSLHKKEDNSAPYSWAMVSSIGKSNPPKEVALWMIFTREAHRRKGYAKILIESLKGIFDTIITQYECMNSPGTCLCLDCGFEAKKNIFNNRGPSTLIWERKKDEKGNSSTKEGAQGNG